VTSIWRVTARYMRAIFRNSQSIISKNPDGTNRRTGLDGIHEAQIAIVVST
jgi:hypothetical protein